MKYSQGFGYFFIGVSSLLRDGFSFIGSYYARYAVYFKEPPSPSHQNAALEKHNMPNLLPCKSLLVDCDVLNLNSW